MKPTERTATIRRLRSNGVPPTTIAERLGCCLRTVQRALQGQTWPDMSALVGTEDEVILWRVARESGFSYREIGHYYGVSHQTIANHLGQPRVVEGDAEIIEVVA